MLFQEIIASALQYGGRNERELACCFAPHPILNGQASGPIVVAIKNRAITPTAKILLPWIRQLERRAGLSRADDFVPDAEELCQQAIVFRNPDSISKKFRGHPATPASPISPAKELLKTELFAISWKGNEFAAAWAWDGRLAGRIIWEESANQTNNPQNDPGRVGIVCLFLFYCTPSFCGAGESGHRQSFGHFNCLGPSLQNRQLAEGNE